MEIQIETIFFYLAIGIFFFSGSILVMVLLFGLAVKDVGKNMKGIFALILLSSILPITLFALTNQGKNTRISSATGNPYYEARMLPVDDMMGIVEFKTKEKVVAFIEIRGIDGNTYSFVPTNGYQNTNIHLIPVENRYLWDGEIFIVIKGNRYPLQL